MVSARRASTVAVVIALGLANLLFAAGAHARGHLQTRQTGVDIPAGARAGRLVLANTGDAPVAAQVRLYAWTQDGSSEDTLTPSTAMVASPPIVEIPAGGEQLVRLVRPTSQPPAREQAYRAVVDELPGPADGDDATAVTVRMRYVIPVFVRAADPAPVELQCSVEQGASDSAADASGTAALLCHNRGGRAAQLGATLLIDASGQSLTVTDGLLGYVLAGSSRRWPLDADKLATVGPLRTLEVRLNGQPAQVELGSGQ